MNSNLNTQIQIKKPNSHWNKIFQDLIIGGLSGGISKTVMAPLERLKLLIQNQIIINNLNVKYEGNFNCIKRVYIEQGLLSFWRGNLANVVRYIPSFAINVTLKERFKALNKYNKSERAIYTLFFNLLAGSLAGVISVVVVYPLDFARTRLALDINKKENREFKGIIDCILKIYKLEGICAIYNGFVMTLIGNTIYRGIYFGLYDTIKYQGKESNFWKNWFISFLTTGFGGFASYPFDTVRRRMMAQSGKEIKDYINTIDCIKQIFRKEGYTGFFKGGVANLIRSIGGGFNLILNDELNRIYNNRKDKRH